MNPIATRHLCISLLAVGACQPPLEQWQGENIEYLSSPSLQVCGGTHRQLDDFVSFFAAEMGVPIPSGITYIWLDDLADAKCSEGSAGCARGKSAFSEMPMLPHELVHTIAGPNRIDAWPFFAEGLATAYDPWSGSRFGGRYVLVPGGEGAPLPDPRLSLTLPADELFYATAGSFVSFLLSRHGPERFVAMTKRLPEERDLDVLRQIFRDTYPTELDDEAELFMVGADCGEDAFPTLVYDCTMPEVAWETPKSWEYHRTVDCADDDVTGGYKPGMPYPSVHSVTLDVPVSGTYTLQVKSNYEIAVQFGPCFGCPWENREELGRVGTSAVVLDAGPHYLRIGGWSERPADIEVNLIPP